MVDNNGIEDNPNCDLLTEAPKMFDYFISSVLICFNN